MVALTTLNLPTEAWKSARLLRAVPNCRLVLMLAYHMLSPALSIEETGLMAYVQTPPEAEPSLVQVTSGLQNWKCAGRRLVEIGGRLPTATQLHQSFIKILSKHLAANKKVNFVFQQQSSTIPILMMNPSPTKIVELFSFVEVTLIQYAAVAGHFPGVAASSEKPKPKKANKVEVTPDEPIKGEAQINATKPTTPRPKPKAQNSQSSPVKVENKPPDAKKGGKGGGKGKRGKSEPRMDKRKQQCIHFFRGTCQRGSMQV